MRSIRGIIKLYNNTVERTLVICLKKKILEFAFLKPYKSMRAKIEINVYKDRYSCMPLHALILTL
jgi:hypothetical protein